MLAPILTLALLPQGQVDVDSFVEKATAAAQKFVDAERVVGISAGVVTEELGSVTFAVGRVSADDAKTPDENTLYEIGSVSKVLTGILLGESLLRDELTLEDTVLEHLPEGVTLAARRDDPIRLVHLTTHGSGLPRMPPNFDLENTARSWSEYGEDELYQCLSEFKALRQPGKRYAYSNLAVGLLGHVLELKLETPYEELLIELLCSPLGMNSTRIVLNEELKARFAPGTDSSLEPAPAWDMAVLAPCGGIRSSSADMLEFLKAHLDGDSPLDGAFREALQVRSEYKQGKPQLGLGWHVAGDGVTRIHSGETAGYHAYCAINMVSGVGVIVLTNTATPIIDVLGNYLVNLALSVELPLPAFKTPFPLPEERLAAYTGRFESPTFAIEVTRKGTKFFAQVDGPGQGNFRVMPVSETRFEYLDLEASMEFAIEKDGTIAKMTFRQNGLEHNCTRVDSED